MYTTVHRSAKYRRQNGRAMVKHIPIYHAQTSNVFFSSNLIIDV